MFVVVVVVVVLLFCCFVVLLCCCVVVLLCCCVVVLLCCYLCPTPKDPKQCLGERAGPHLLVWVWRCCGCGCCGCCWFGLPRTTFRRTLPPPDRPKFRSFSSFSRHRFAVSASLWVSSRWILVVFWRPEPWNVHVWALGLSCETPAAPRDRAAGARRSPRTPNVHIWAPHRFKHHQNSTRRHPERKEKNEFCGGTRKKSAKFWAPIRGPTLRGPTFSRFGPPTLRGPTLLGPTLLGPTLLGPTLLGSWPTLAKPTLASLFCYRVWPNRLWPELVF